VPPTDDVRRRAQGALYGLAIGDALGMPTQLRGRREIVERYGELIEGFEPGPADHPIAAGLPAGQVTDDTEQAVLIGRLLVAGGGTVDARDLTRALGEWERDVAARGSLDLLGPSSRAALAALAAGTPPEEAGRHGTTNGAAMRITPVGIATPAGPGLVDRVEEVSRPTHNTGVALAGAAAVAAAVSAAIDGASVTGAIGDAIAAARMAAGRGHWVAGADVAARIRWAAGSIVGLDLPEVLDVVVRLVGTSLATQESVPAAFALVAALPDDPWLAVRAAASLGGDTDTIAAMVGAVLGAVHGVDAWPAPAVRLMDGLGLDLPGLAAALLDLRSTGGAADPVGRAAVRPVAGAADPAGRADAQPVADPAARPAPAASGPEPTAPATGRLVLVGAAVLDVTAWVPAPPPRGGDLMATAAALSPGGGFNVMAAAARQGAAVLYAGRHGTGPAGDAVRRAMAAEGIACLRRVDPAADTGVVLTTVEPDGERTFVTDPAALLALTPAELAEVPVSAGDVVYASGYGLLGPGGDDLAAWLAALDPAATLVVDPGPLAADIPPARLEQAGPRIDWWSGNQAEAAVLTGLADPDRAAAELAAGRRGGAVVRLGAAGCLLAPAGQPPRRLPAPAVSVLDTTGAGDAHVGAFVAGLLAGLDPVNAAARATVAAAVAVTRRGPATAPDRAELDRRLASGSGVWPPSTPAI